MGFWKKLLGDENAKVDYYQEGLELLRVHAYHEALTSFRLALRDSPNDLATLQQIAISYTRIGMTDEAAKTYRQVLQKHPGEPGAHYGLAFLLLQAGKQGEAAEHLRAFLATPPGGPEAMRHVHHARETLEQITGSAGEPG